MSCVKWVQTKIRGIHSDFFPQHSPVCCDFSKQAMRILCKERTEIVCNFQLFNLVWTPVFCAHGFGCWISNTSSPTTFYGGQSFNEMMSWTLKLYSLSLLALAFFMFAILPPSSVPFKVLTVMATERECELHQPCWSSDYSSCYAHALFRNWSSSYVARQPLRSSMQAFIPTLQNSLLWHAWVK